MCSFFGVRVVKKFMQQLEKTFGPLGSPIGNGDSGKVYRVSHPDHEGLCALKVPNVSSARAALKQEFDRARLLPPHENLIQYLHCEFFQHDPFPAPAPMLSFGAEGMDVDHPISATPTGTSHLTANSMGGGSASFQPAFPSSPHSHQRVSATSSQFGSAAKHFGTPVGQTNAANFGFGQTTAPSTQAPALAANVLASPAQHANASVAVLLELAVGGSLLDRVKNRALPEAELRFLARDILEGLRHIHAHGYMHLDIKPANIFLTENGRAKIGDFGRLCSYESYSPHSTPEGDSTYLAPEIYGDVPFPVHGPDIFSLGVTILECATDLEIPRSGGFDSEGYQLLRHDQCPEQFLRDLSPELQSMLLQMLRRNANDRPNAEELLADPFFESLPPLPDGPRRKIRSTSSPLTPYANVSTPVPIASSAPSQHYFLTSRVAMSVPHSFVHHHHHHREQHASEDSSVRRRIYFPPDTD